MVCLVCIEILLPSLTLKLSLSKLTLLVSQINLLKFFKLVFFYFFFTVVINIFFK